MHNLPMIRKFYVQRFKYNMSQIILVGQQFYLLLSLLTETSFSLPALVLRSPFRIIGRGIGGNGLERVNRLLGRLTVVFLGYT